MIGLQSGSKDTAVVSRLTDTKGYTGSHKERFDDSGKGKGIVGRENRCEHAAKGYVGDYKGEGTHGKKDDKVRKYVVFGGAFGYLMFC